MGKKENIAEYFREKRAKIRKGEKIGGGYVVFAIDPESGRIMPPPVPFEHPGFARGRQGREVSFGGES